MNDNIILILAILISGGIGAYIGMTIAKLKSKSEQSTLEERLNQMSLSIEALKQNSDKIEIERDDIRREKEILNAELTRKQADFENLQLKNEEQKLEVEKLQEKFTKEFENLANKILDENSKKFTVQNKDNIDAILKPLQDKINNL